MHIDIYYSPETKQVYFGTHNKKAPTDVPSLRHIKSYTFKTAVEFRVCLRHIQALTLKQLYRLFNLFPRVSSDLVSHCFIAAKPYNRIKTLEHPEREDIESIQEQEYAYA